MNIEGFTPQEWAEPALRTALLKTMVKTGSLWVLYKIKTFIKKLVKKEILIGWLTGDVWTIWFPIFALTVENGKLILFSPFQRFEFYPNDIVAIRNMGPPCFAVRIYHVKDEYPLFMLFGRSYELVFNFLEENKFFYSNDINIEQTSKYDGHPIYESMKISLVYIIVGAIAFAAIFLASYIAFVSNNN